MAVLLVCRFDVAPDAGGASAGADEGAFLARARRAVALLAEQPGCRGVELGRGVDEQGAWVLVARFDSVTAYRRALSPFAVREHVVPWLAEARTTDTAAFERLLEGAGGEVIEYRSLLGGTDPERDPDRRAR